MKILRGLFEETNDAHLDLQKHLFSETKENVLVNYFFVPLF